MRRHLAALLLSVTLLMAATACTPAQVTAFFASRGTTIDRPTAVFVAQALDQWADQQRILLAYLAALPRDVVSIERAAAREFGVPEGDFVRVLGCESGHNPRAVNRSSGALGLGQHLPAYYGARAAALGYQYSSWSDPRANARVSAWLWATSGPQNWSCY